MPITKNYLAVVLATLFATSGIGCGKGMRSAAPVVAEKTSEQSDGSFDISEQLNKAEEASKEAQKAMAEAEVVLAEIMDENGNVRINLFASTSVDSQTRTVGLLSPLLDKLNGVFDRVFEKVDFVKTQFANARMLLIQAMAKLDPNNAAHLSAIQAIKDQLNKIDGLERAFASSMHGLASKLDLATSALDKLINLGTSFIPVPGLGAVAGILIDLFLTGEVKDYISTVKLRLLQI